MATGKVPVKRKTVPTVKVTQGKVKKPVSGNWKVHVLDDMDKDLPKIKGYKRAHPLVIDIENTESKKLFIVFKSLGAQGVDIGSGR